MRSARRTLIVALLLFLGRTLGSTFVDKSPAEPEPTAPANPPLHTDWVDTVFASLTLEEKVAQLLMPRAWGHYISTESEEFERLARLVQERRVGGLVMAQGDVYETAHLLRKLQRLSKVPLLISSDYERGVAMRVRRATPFPDAMALGATRNPGYAYRIGKAIARESRALGVHQNFAPVADVNINPSNPVINTRAFGDEPGLVAQMVEAFVRGSNDGGVISTVKHFPGHGDTGIDSHLELPVLHLTRERLDSVELVSFKSAIQAGVKSVMIAHLAVPSIDSAANLPATLSQPVITDLLQKRLGFKGLVVTDAMEMAAVSRNFSVEEAAVQAIKAGVDVILVPPSTESALKAIVGAVRRGDITLERLNASVKKVLGAKQWLGLDTNRLVDSDAIADLVGTRANWYLAKQAARDALTLVKNDGGILPLAHQGRKRIAVVVVTDSEDGRTDVNRPDKHSVVEPAGSNFVHEMRQRHDHVESFRLTPVCTEERVIAALNGIKRADIVVIALSVKVRTSSGRIGIPENLTGFVLNVNEIPKPAVVVSFGNPYLITAFPKAEALLCAYGDCEPLVEAAVEGLFGEVAVRGSLPVTISRQFAYGNQVVLAKSVLRSEEPVDGGFDAGKLNRVDSILTRAIDDSAFSGVQLAVMKDGILAYNKCFGKFTYESSAKEIDAATMFDLASVTKAVALTSAVMKLYDGSKLSLDDPVSKYIPQFAEGKKARITIRALLTHTGGLPPFRKLWEVCKTPAEAIDSVFASQLVAWPGDSTIYSDFGAIILGKIVEKVAGKPLDVFVEKEFFEPLDMRRTMYAPPQSLRAQCAPTEVDTVWRKRMVQGTVHDENAAFLGGVSGHAGLFSTASDLAVFMQMLLNKGTYGGRRYLAGTTVDAFTKRQSTSSTRALGWDTKAATNSSAGSLFSMSSFGHTGFTGTSIWADPERNLCVILLSNRVHPTRANTKIFKVRPAIHDAVVEALVNTPTGVQGKDRKKTR